MGYTLYVDESGDAGIKKIRDGDQAGASPMMTMGGVLIPDHQLDATRQALGELRAQITKRDHFHCQNMPHEEKVRLAQFVNQLPVILVGVISAKSTLGGYKKEIKEDKNYYYNKCCQYLLERAGMVASSIGLGPDETAIVLEEGNYDYRKLRNLITKCQLNPHHQNTKYLQNISTYQIRSLPKNHDPLLELADLVAHALYRSVWGSKLGVTEKRYLDEIRTKFFRDKDTGKALGKGLYVVHKPSDLKLATDITTYFDDF